MSRRVTVGLHATIVAVTGDEPRVLTVSGGAAAEAAPALPSGPLDPDRRRRGRRPDAAEAAPALPFGPLDPDRHRTLELGLRAWVREQTGMDLAHVEQLYTFGDRDRGGAADEGTRVIAVAYLALVRERHPGAGHSAAWQPVYRFLPWEDHRGGEPALLRDRIRPALDAWPASAPPGAARRERRGRVAITFGSGAAGWDAERVLDRYELLYEAGLVAEARRAGGAQAGGGVSGGAAFGEGAGVAVSGVAVSGSGDRVAGVRVGDIGAGSGPGDRGAASSAGSGPASGVTVSGSGDGVAVSGAAGLGAGVGVAVSGGGAPEFGAPLALDHRRILATALGRLRGKLRYRPLVFELLPETFTLLQLQRTVETLAGVRLHKQNFRRLVERGALVEGTGRREPATGGRPAELFRFRREVQHERPAPGVGLPGLPAAGS